MSISVKDLNCSRGGNLVLDSISVDFCQGELTGIVGPNGSGKSTFLRLLYGYLKPQGGQVELLGRPLETIAPSELARDLGVCPQEAGATLDFRVDQALMLGREKASLQEALKSYPFLKLEGLLGRHLSELSGGEKQRVRLFRALVGSPRWLLLDEPANHLDLGTTWALMSFLSTPQQDRGAVVALHDLNLAVRFCRNLVILREGRLVSYGATREVLTEATLLDVFGLRARMSDSGPVSLTIEGAC